MSKNVLLIDENILKERTAIHGNIDPKLLYPEIKAAQDMYIEPILGSALFNKIINEVDAATITGTYKSLLDDYIIDALCWYVVSALPDAISYQFWNKGVVRKQGDSTELPSMSELLDISNKYRNRAEWYGERLNKYLKAYASTTVLPEYLSGNDQISDIQPEGNSYSMPIWLGDYQSQSLDKNNCNCNE